VEMEAPAVHMFGGDDGGDYSLDLNNQMILGIT